MNKQDRFRLHPFLYALYFPLWLYATNGTQTEFSQFAWAAGLNLVVTAAAYALLAARMRDRLRAAAVMSAAIVMFFIYGHIHTALQVLTVDPWLVLFSPQRRPYFVHYAVIVTHMLLILVCAAAAVWLTRRMMRSASRPVMANRILALAAVYLVVSALASAAWQGVAGRSEARQDTAVEKKASLAASPARSAPDIYYVILDGFARPDVMNNFYYCDLSGMLANLRELVIYVPSKSRSNYSQTILSLSSSLNMTLHEAVKEVPDGDDQDSPGDHWNRDRLYFQMIRDNRVMRFLKERGYRIVNLASIWSVTMNMPQADIQFKYRKGLFGSEYGKALYGMSLLKVFYAFFVHDIAEWHLYNFGKLGEVSRIASPKMVFAHMVLPHSPYVFDRNGDVLRHINRTNIWDMDNNQYQDLAAYREQAMFTAREIMRTVNKILAENSENPPIIVLQADHGMNLLINRPVWLARSVRHANFCAIYFPDRDYSRLYPEITPVNIFRIILDKYFGQELGRLPDTTFYTGQ